MGHESGLPPDLPFSERGQFYEGILRRVSCRLSEGALRICDEWGISGVGLVGRIQDHFAQGFRVYRKPAGHAGDRFLPWACQANVRIYESLQIYVSLFIRDNSVLDINAHPHTSHLILPR